MPPEDTVDEGNASGSDFVYCRSCGAKAPSGWSFCRSCESSLADALPPERKRELSTELYGESDSDVERGCPKCGHDEVEVDIVETTGIAVTPRIAAQNDRFRVVSCAHCGFCEFYLGGDPEILADLFLER